MTIALAFDIYGTLIDTQDIAKKLKTILGPKADAFSDLWRSKQLEYSFRRGLMQDYVSFSVCTAQALDYCCLYYNLLLSENQKRVLLDAYAVLPAYDDVKESLKALSAKGIHLYAFSNGSKKAVNNLLENAHIDRYFTAVVSVDDVKSFKPDPAVYQHLINQTGLGASQLCLISSNPFDVTGALSVGLKAIWLKRSAGAVFDPWGMEPTAIVQTLDPSILLKSLDRP